MFCSQDVALVVPVLSAPSFNVVLLVAFLVDGVGVLVADFAADVSAADVSEADVSVVV